MSTGPKQDNAKPNSDGFPFNCSRCGTRHLPRQCPAFGKTCFVCDGRNHFAKMCNQRSRKVHTVVPLPSPVFELFVGELEVDLLDNKAWFSKMEVAGEIINFKLDTRAEANVMPLHTFDRLQSCGSLQRTCEVLTSYGNHKVVLVGKVTLNCTMKKQTHSLSFFVVADVPSVPILGLRAYTQFGVVKKIDSMAEPVCSKETVLLEYKDVFEGLGCMPQEYRIEIQSDAVPVVHPPCRVPFSLHGKLKETLDRMEKNGVIARVDRPTDWVNSLVIAEKKDGNLRLCLDPHDLNKVIKRELYKIPTAEEIASKLPGKSVFSILDEKDGFWQIPLDGVHSFVPSTTLLDDIGF